MLKVISESIDPEIFLRTPLTIEKPRIFPRLFNCKGGPERKKEIRKTNLFLVGAEGVEPPTLCL